MCFCSSFRFTAVLTEGSQHPHILCTTNTQPPQSQSQGEKSLLSPQSLPERWHSTDSWGPIYTAVHQHHTRRGSDTCARTSSLLQEEELGDPTITCCTVHLYLSPPRANAKASAWPKLCLLQLQPGHNHTVQSPGMMLASSFGISAFKVLCLSVAGWLISPYNELSFVWMCTPWTTAWWFPSLATGNKAVIERKAAKCKGALLKLWPENTTLS